MLYRDNYSVRVAVFGIWITAAICILIATQSLIVLEIAAIVLGLDSLRAAYYLKYGGISFDKTNNIVKIVNTYRTYKIPLNEVESFDVGPFGGLMSLLGKTGIVKMKDQSKSVRVTSISQPLESKDPEKFHNVQQLIKTLNHRLDELASTTK